MNYSYIIFFISTIIVNVIHLYGYKELQNIKRLEFNIKNIFLLIIMSIFIFCNCLYNTGLIKPVLSFICLIILFYSFSHDKFNILLSYGLVNYLLVTFVEIILSVFLIVSKISSYELFEKSMIIKCIFSIITLIIVYHLCKLKICKKIALKISSLINKSKAVGIIILLSFLLPIILQYKYLNNVNIITYAMNVILFIIFGIFVSFLVYYEIKIYNETQKYDTLLTFISKYEKIIDEQRIGRHEIHNNLLILKSYSNKNSNEFNEILNHLIDSYSSTEPVIKNMYKLPNGIKGIVYYKLMNISKNDINLNVNISKQVKFKLLKKDNKEYYTLCKILGIILDNAIEAAKDSDEKILNIDIYNENKSTIFLISNSYNSKKIDISKINTIKYSTKGKGRGYGLSIANKLACSSNHIKLNQYLENKYFVTKISYNN